MSEQQEEKIVGWKAKTRKLFAVKEGELVERCVEGTMCESRNISGRNIDLKEAQNCQLYRSTSQTN